MKYPDNTYIAILLAANFSCIKGFRIGELLESFFDNINYNVVRTGTNDPELVFVEFTGDAECDDEPCTVYIKFAITVLSTTKVDFKMVQIKVNGEELDHQETVDLLEDIAYAGGATFEEELFSGYKPSCTGETCAKCKHRCSDYDEFEDDYDDDEDFEDEEYIFEDEEDDDDKEDEDNK